MKVRQEQRAAMWKELAAAACKDINIGDVVLLQVDYRERKVLDPHFLAAVVMRTFEKGGFQCAASLDGMLKGTFHIGEKACVPSTDVTALWDMAETKAALEAIALSESDMKKFCEKPKISLGVAERKKMGWNASRKTGICGCKGKCDSRQCRCFKAGLNCSSKCHDGALVFFLYSPHQKYLTHRAAQVVDATQTVKTV
jgi:hypothetical protein